MSLSLGAWFWSWNTGVGFIFLLYSCLAGRYTVICKLCDIFSLISGGNQACVVSLTVSLCPFTSPSLLPIYSLLHIIFARSQFCWCLTDRWTCIKVTSCVEYRSAWDACCAHGGHSTCWLFGKALDCQRHFTATDCLTGGSLIDFSTEHFKMTYCLQCS